MRCALHGEVIERTFCEVPLGSFAEPPHAATIGTHPAAVRRYAGAGACRRIGC